MAYGFKDKQVAEKLKKMVNASASGGGVGGGGVDRGGGIPWFNYTGERVPPFGLLFDGGVFTAYQGNLAGIDYAGRQGLSYTQAKGYANTSKSKCIEHTFLNNAMPVEPDTWGWTQPDDGVMFGLTKDRGSVSIGKEVRLIDSNNEHHFYTDRYGGFEQPPGLEYIAHGTFEGSHYGADEDDRILVVSKPSSGDPTVMMTGTAKDAGFPVHNGLTRFTITPTWFSDGTDPDGLSPNYVYVAGHLGYPIAAGQAVACMQIPGGIRINTGTGGGLGGGSSYVTVGWLLLSSALNEMAWPSGGGSGGTTPTTP